MSGRPVSRPLRIRTALGASRRRILAQLFVEALALSLLGTAIGLELASIAPGYMQGLARSAGASGSGFASSCLRRPSSPP